MKKILSLLLAFLLFANTAFATFGGSAFNIGAFSSGGFGGRFGEGSQTTLQQLQSFGGLTFYKNYATSQTTGDADYSVGSGTITVTAARSATAPATYFNSAGLIQTTTTANTPRFTQGIWNATGWHPYPGIVFEYSVSNALKSSTNTFSDANWTKTNMTATDSVSVSGVVPNGTVSTLTATSANATLTQAVTAGAAIRTASIFVRRKTGTGTINLRGHTTNSYTDVTALIDADPTRWVRVQAVTTSLANPTFDLQIVTSGDELYIYQAQLENNPYMTSPIPTTSAGLTRALETPSYVNAGNRTGASETIFLKFAIVGGGLANDNINRDFLWSDSNLRMIRKVNNQTTLKTYPNNTLSVSSVITNVTQPQVDTNFMFAVSMQNTYASLGYINTYVNGAVDTTNTANNFTTQSLGTNFYIGASNSIYQAIAIYSSSLELPAVNAISSILDSSVTPHSYTYTYGSTSSVSGGNSGTTNASSVYEWGTSIFQTGADTIVMIDRDGSDAQYAAFYEGAVWLRTFTISTLTWSAATKVIDFAGSGYQILWCSARVEGDHLIIYLNKTRTADQTKGLVTMIESTDLTGSSWGSEISVIPEQTGQIGIIAKLMTTSNPAINYNIMITGQAGTNWSLYQVSNGGRTLTFDHVMQASATWSELGFTNYTALKKMAVARVAAGGYLAQTNSTDGGLTWSTPVSTGLGNSTGTKVTPSIQNAAGSSNRFMTVFYDRGSNRLSYENTNADAAFNNTWSAAGFIGTTNGQGNGDFLPYIDANGYKRYLVVMPKEITTTTINLLWWILQDNYSWVAN